jgi:hypothetical protein
MSKKVDANGYWYIKHNPISKEGVFPYLGHTISDECEPNKVYKVYRSAKVLQESVPTWDNPPKPFIDDHEMLGEGFTAIDDRPVQGIIYNPECKDGVLYADIAVYSEDLKQNIEDGKKELSLGYFCKYKKERGVFKGEVYDYVQYDMVGNHIALVDAGRCGSDVKVFDHKCTMDSLDLGHGFEKESVLKTMDESGIIESKETKGIKMYVTIDEVRRLLTESFTYGDEVDPKVKLIMTALEAKAKQTLDEDETKEKEKKSEDSDDEEKEEKKTEDKCGKDEDEEKKESEDSDDEDKEEKKSTEDSLKELMSVVKDMADDVKKLVAGKAQDEDEEEKKESEDESEEEEKEEKAEDSDDDEEKTSEDSAVFVFGADSAIDGDEALAEYLK